MVISSIEAKAEATPVTRLEAKSTALRLLLNRYMESRQHKFGVTLRVARPNNGLKNNQNPYAD